MPADYTYRSKSLFFVMWQGAQATPVWKAFVSTTDGWCTARRGIASSLTATSTTAINASAMLPAGGEADLFVEAENTGGTNRTFTLYRNIGGTAVTGVNPMGSIRVNASRAGRPWAMMTIPINVPAAGSANDDETFYYSWSAAATGAAIDAVRWRTDAYAEE
tara:strand:+ start:98 stop:583 length:486 start_codon:yes stop_codon:yes gene_type:complete